MRASPPPRLTGARTVLRLVGPADASALAQALAHPEVGPRLIGWTPLLTPPAIGAWIAARTQAWTRGHSATFAITHLGEDRARGTVSARFVPGLTASAAPRHAELGYWLARDAWGQGLAGEAVASVIAWVFELGVVDHVRAQVAVDNHRSQALLARLGFARTPGAAGAPWHTLALAAWLARGADFPNVGDRSC